MSDSTLKTRIRVAFAILSPVSFPDTVDAMEARIERVVPCIRDLDTYIYEYFDASIAYTDKLEAAREAAADFLAEIITATHDAVAVAHSSGKE